MRWNWCEVCWRKKRGQIKSRLHIWSSVSHDWCSEKFCWYNKTFYPELCMSAFCIKQPHQPKTEFTNLVGKNKGFYWDPSSIHITIMYCFSVQIITCFIIMQVFNISICLHRWSCPSLFMHFEIWLVTIRCYIFINGQCGRFLPEDLKMMLPIFFVKSDANMK